VVVLALVACKKASPKPGDAALAPATTGDAGRAVDAAGASPARATDAAVGVPDDALATVPADGPAGGLVARLDGVGPITKETKPTKKALAALFPDHQVKWFSIDQGGDLREEYFGVRKGKTLLLRVRLGAGSSLEAVDIVSNDVANPFGLTLGMTHADVAKAIGPLDCEDAGIETDWRRHIAVCTAAKAGKYMFDFESEQNTSGEDMVAEPAKLAPAKLVAITWIASSWRDEIGEP